MATVTRIALLFFLIAMFIATEADSKDKDNKIASGSKKCNIPGLISKGGGSQEKSGEKCSTCTSIARVQVLDPATNVLSDKTFCPTCTNGVTATLDPNFCINNPSLKICGAIKNLPDCIGSVLIYTCCPPPVTQAAAVSLALAAGSSGYGR